MTEPNRFKFRAWDEVNKRMEYPTEMRFREGYPIDMRSEAHRMIWLRDETPLMQSTGLLDKKGVEIFEGDVLKYGTSDLLYRVAWEAPEFALYDYPDFHGGDGWTPWPEHKDRSSIKLEVIGNIYQSPKPART